MNIFKLGKHNFSIDLSESEIDLTDSYINLEIKTNEEEFEKKSNDENFELEWGIYPPLFYANDLEIKSGEEVEITKDNIYNYEVALYFMKHCDSYVKIQRENNCIKIDGTVDLGGKDYRIFIEIDI